MLSRLAADLKHEVCRFGCHRAIIKRLPLPILLCLFSLLSFRLFRLTLSQPLPELPLTFFTFVVGEDVREDAPGDVLDFVLRNTGIVDELLPVAQAGYSLRFDMKFLGTVVDGRTICVDGMAPFSRNGKCRRLSNLWLDGRLHFAFLYYITLGVGVNSLGRVRDVEE